jgi:hypothetical protein
MKNMLALATNFFAFYLGAIYIERCGIFCGVAVFLLISLLGTIMASGLEKYICSMTARAFNRCGNRVARQTSERPYPGR